MKRRQPLKVGPSVGLEITAASLRAVEVKIDARETVVQRLTSIDTPERSVRDGQVADPTALAGALRRLWEKGGFSTRRCGVALPARILTQQMLTVPPAPPNEQRLIVRGELARFATVTDETRFGWLPMASGGGPGGNALAFLAEENAIAGYQQALSMAGLEVEAFEPDAVAALRAAEPALLPYEAVAVLYVTESCSEMAFLESGRVRYHRRLDLGIREFTDASAAAPSALDPGLAGLDGDAWGEGRWDLPAESPEDVFGAVEAVPEPGAFPGETLRPLALEIERSLQYYGRAYGDAPQPHQVLLLGDAPLERVARILREDLNLESDYLRPLGLHRFTPGITAEIEAVGEQSLVALGLALRPLAEYQTGVRLDLKARDESQILARHAPRYLVTALTGSISVLVLALAASMLLDLRLSQARNRLHTAEAELKTVRAEHAALVAGLQRVKMEADRLRKQALPVPRLLTDLGTMMPDALAVTALDLKEDGSLTLEGDALTPRQVNGLLEQLSYSPEFRPPSLNTLDAHGRRGTIYFKVQTGLAGYGKRPKQA